MWTFVHYCGTALFAEFIIKFGIKPRIREMVMAFGANVEIAVHKKSNPFTVIIQHNKNFKKKQEGGAA